MAVIDGLGVLRMMASAPGDSFPGHDPRRAKDLGPAMLEWEMSALQTYLDYYENRAEPGYAVLVTGAWGVGKTHQVRSCLQQHQPFYVSLFGLKSTDDIYQAVFAAMYPEVAAIRATAEANKETNVAGMPIGAFASQFVSMFIREKAETDRTLVLDDLERCPLPAVELLGVVNRYVEHHGCRVVVIAHEGKLPKELLEQREKTFGQTIQVQPNIDDAYLAFSAEFGSLDAAGALVRFRDNLTALFRESGTQSLRILRHVMEDTVRLTSCLTEEILGHEEASREVVLLVAALNFERRAERIAADDVANRNRADFMYRLARQDDEAATESPIAAATRRYTPDVIDSPLLSDDILKTLLFDGVFDAPRIRQSILSSPYFAKPADLPAWQVFIEFQRRDDRESEEAMVRLNSEFEKLAIRNPGEMLHAFALRMMMSINGLIKPGLQEVTSECKKYIEDLRAAGQLKHADSNYMDREDLGHGYGGYGYWVEDAARDAFGEVYQHLFEQRWGALLDSLPGEVPGLLHLMEHDVDRFVSELQFTGADHPPRFGEVPVLAQIPADEFVATWMRSPEKNWRTIRATLQERRKRARDHLGEEVAWLNEVVRLMNLEAAKAVGIRSLRIRRMAPNIE